MNNPSVELVAQIKEMQDSFNLEVKYEDLGFINRDCCGTYKKQGVGVAVYGVDEVQTTVQLPVAPDYDVEPVNLVDDIKLREV